VLPGLERSSREGRMRSVSGRNNDSVDVDIVDDSVLVWCDTLKTELTLGRFGGRARASTNDLETSACFDQRRDENSLREHTWPDQANPCHIPRRRSAITPDWRDRWLLRRRLDDGLRIWEQESAARSIRWVASDGRVRPRSLFDWQDLRDQRTKVEQPPWLKVENAPHVPLLRPADVADWVVQSPLLIFSVVATRTVGARDPEGEFLAVEGRSRKLDRHIADKHDYAAITGEVTRQEKWLARRGSRSYQHGV
jgi:hypothetical protein